MKTLINYDEMIPLFAYYNILYQYIQTRRFIAQKKYFDGFESKLKRMIIFFIIMTV